MTQSFFDDSHVTDIGLQGSLGPSVGLFDMVQQGFRQQYRVDSAFALDAELDSRWRESLRALSDAGQQFNFRGGNPYVMRDFARYIREGTVPQGQRVVLSQEAETMGEARLESANDDFEEMRRANEAIRQLNNPNIRTFEQILEEVSAMQRDVEQETASMSERGGWSGFFGELFGAIGGSFTVRDPLNLFTAGFGAGRTVATRIAAEMGIAGGITAVTEYGDVAPNRALAELPERSSIFNITAAALGAGIIRGGFEAIGAGIRATPAFQQRAALRELESLDFDARDTSLRALLETLPESPRARAAASADVSPASAACCVASSMMSSRALTPFAPRPSAGSEPSMLYCAAARDRASGDKSGVAASATSWRACAPACALAPAMRICCASTSGGSSFEASGAW